MPLLLDQHTPEKFNHGFATYVLLASSHMRVGQPVRAADQGTFQTRWRENASRVRLAVTLKKEHIIADHVQQGHTVMLQKKNALSVHLVPFLIQAHLTVNIAAVCKYLRIMKRKMGGKRN